MARQLEIISTFILFILTVFVVSSCTSTNSNPLTISLISNVSECNQSEVNEFMNKKFALEFVNTTACDYKFLGYGGANRRNISVITQNGVVNSTVFFSGMGSGGHGYTTYCFAATSPSDMKIASEHICNSLTYRIADFTCQNITDVTQPIVEACIRGLFTINLNGTSVFSVTSRSSRCASYVEVGTYNCVSELIDMNATKDKILQLVNVSTE